MPTMKRFVFHLTAATFGCGLVAASASADGPGPLRAAGVKGPLGDERLSDEFQLSRVGYPTRKYKIRSGPARSFHTIGRLRYYTEDSAPENYLALSSKLGPNGKAWLQIRVPQRPNGTKGWVPARALRLRIVTTSFEIDKRALKARLFKDGHEIWTSSVGIGASGTPTPSGRYWVRERLSNLGGNPAYGPFAFGTSAYSRLSDWPGGGVVGIHGTNAPGLIPGRPSHGCVRVPNAKILKLKQLMPVGTPIWIHD
jgi:lipoprotein-anchoring transpeptidase ErfK/SrfK